MLTSAIALALVGASSGVPIGDATPASSGTASASAPAPDPAEASPVDADQLLLLSVDLDGQTLTESLTAYGDAADPLIPLGELSRLLELPLEVRPAEGLVTGRLGEGERALTIDLKSGHAMLAGRRIAVQPGDVKVTGSDIYLATSLVARLLPLTVRLAPDDSTMSLSATEKLPIQARRDRVARMRGLMDSPVAGESVMRVDNPYGWASRPAFDFGMELGADSTRGRATTRFEARMSGDLLKTGMTGWIATDENGSPSSARLTATRRGTGEDMLGLTSVAAGDVYTPTSSLGPRSSGGAGIAFSTARQEEASVFQKIDLRGELPIGYDVELYVNDVLRSGQQGAKTQGRYEFTDVPLVRGRNVLRVVLYGPRGERSEQTRVINVGGGQLAAGQTTIDAGLVAQERPVFQLSQDTVLPGNLGQGSLRAVVNVAHGFTAGLTSAASFSSYEDMTGQRHNVLGAGLRTSLLGASLQADVAKDLRSGAAFSLGAAGKLGGINYLARHVEYSGAFQDEVNIAWDAARAMRRYDEVTLDFALPLGKQARLPISARIDRAQFVDGGTSFSARARTAATLAGTLVAIGGDYTRRTGPSGKDEQFSGYVSASRFVDYKWQLRGNVEYRMKPKFAVEALGFTADRAIGDRYSLRFGASRSFSARDVTLQAGFTARLPFADATLGGDWSTQQKRWRVGLQLNFGLAFDPLARRYRMTPPGPANGGSAALLAFIDNDANGEMDAGEEPVSGVELQGGAHTVVTDKQGRAFVTGLGESPSTVLRADIANTDTVFVAPPAPNIALAPRAGSVSKVLYPMVPTSDVSVKLDYRTPDGKITGLSAVRLRLVDGNGNVIEGTTEFDGTVVFDTVKPGAYSVELDPDQARRLGMKLAAPVKAVVGWKARSLSVEGEILFVRSSQ